MGKAVNYKAVLHRVNLKSGQYSKGQIWTSTQAQGSDTLSLKLDVRNY